LARALAVVIALGAAFSRTYRGMHHPTDVFAGLAYGAACLWFAVLAVRAFFAASPPGSERRPFPPAEQQSEPAEPKVVA
jgi:undecaprenyl-diphosphatase